MDDNKMNGDTEAVDINVLAAAAVEMADVETFCVAMATDEYGEQFGLTFQVPLNGRYDDQDRRLGMDTYSTSDHLGRTIYGGIVGVEVDFNTSILTLSFSSSVTETLDVPAMLRFHLPAEKFDEIVAGFRRVLAGDAQAENLSGGR